MIELSNINKTFFSKHSVHHALNNINLTVLPGEIMGVIGKSGAGKSTLIRCVNLLERPTSGLVRVNNIELTELTSTQLRQARHHIGMVFQHFNLISSRTAYENIALPLELLKKSNSEIERVVLSLLEKVDLLEHRDSYPHHLSGGQKQRVAIARALATQPRVLLCDEMTSALDPETTDDILKLIRSLNQELRLSILCITHEMHVIKSIADRVAVIDRGEIVECENVVDLFKNPTAAITRRLIQSVLKSDLPEELQSQFRFEPMPDDQVVLRLTFVGQATLEPILNEFIRQTRMTISILQANIEQLRHEMIGRMIIALQYDAKQLSMMQRFLERKGLMVEVMAYVDQQSWLAR